MIASTAKFRMRVIQRRQTPASAVTHLKDTPVTTQLSCRIQGEAIYARDPKTNRLSFTLSHPYGFFIPQLHRTDNPAQFPFSTSPLF